MLPIRGIYMFIKTKFLTCQCSPYPCPSILSPASPTKIYQKFRSMEDSSQSVKCTSKLKLTMPLSIIRVEGGARNTSAHLWMTWRMTHFTNFCDKLYLQANIFEARFCVIPNIIKIKIYNNNNNNKCYEKFSKYITPYCFYIIYFKSWCCLASHKKSLQFPYVWPFF